MIDISTIDFSNAPQNPKEAGERLIAAFKAGALQPQGLCRYEDAQGRPCAIGYFLPPVVRQQLKSLVADDGRPANVVGAASLDKVIGSGGLEKLTGMSTTLCVQVQVAFDGGCDTGADFACEVKDLTGAE